MVGARKNKRTVDVEIRDRRKPAYVVTVGQKAGRGPL
jgi:hypothetical protein